MSGSSATVRMLPAESNFWMAEIDDFMLVKVESCPRSATLLHAPSVSSIAPRSGELGAPSWKVVLLWCTVILMRALPSVSSMLISLPAPVRITFRGALPTFTVLVVWALGTAGRR